MQPFNINPNQDVVSRKVLPAVIYEFDPTRPYLPSSPYYSQAVYERGSADQYLPENHLWGPRGYYKDKFYTDADRFVYERMIPAMECIHGYPIGSVNKNRFSIDYETEFTRMIRWRDVELRVLNPARLTDVHYMVANVDTATRNVRLYTDVQVKLPFEKFDKVKAVYTLSRHGKEIYKGSSVMSS